MEIMWLKSLRYVYSPFGVSRRTQNGQNKEKKLKTLKFKKKGSAHGMGLGAKQNCD